MDSEKGKGTRAGQAILVVLDQSRSELLDPGLTVIAQNPHALGRLAAERIFARLDGDDCAYSHHVLPTTLIPRGSGEPRQTESHT